MQVSGVGCRCHGLSDHSYLLSFLLFHVPGFVGLTSAKVLVPAKVLILKVLVLSGVGCRAGNVVDVRPLLHMPVGNFPCLYMQRTYTYVAGVPYI